MAHKNEKSTNHQFSGYGLLTWNLLNYSGVMIPMNLKLDLEDQIETEYFIIGGDTMAILRLRRGKVAIEK